ncbi:MAG TPA: aminopeptidase P family protein, partial [Roseiarcus sp.]|nr:aminopeptidase P family protein [Roseiarcus sp.]
AHRLSRCRLNACGYALGAKFTPSWMDPPMFYERNDFLIARDQVYFLHMILMDSDSQTALCLGRTYLVGVHHAEPLNAHNLDLVRK